LALQRLQYLTAAGAPVSRAVHIKFFNPSNPSCIEHFNQEGAERGTVSKEFSHVFSFMSSLCVYDCVFFSHQVKRLIHPVDNVGEVAGQSARRRITRAVTVKFGHNKSRAKDQFLSAAFGNTFKALSMSRNPNQNPGASFNF